MSQKKDMDNKSIMGNNILMVFVAGYATVVLFFMEMFGIVYIRSGTPIGFHLRGVAQKYF